MPVESITCSFLVQFSNITMKWLMLLCFVVAASTKNGFKHAVFKMSTYIAKCAAEEGYGKSTQDQIGSCFYKKAGVLDPDGQLNPDAALALLTLIGMDKADSTDLLQKCTSIAGYDGKDMAYAIFKCMDGGINSYASSKEK